MEYRNLGKCGLKVSELCLGTMQLGWTADEDLSYQILDVAVESGINFIDTANIYSRWVEGNPGGVAETIIGRWMKRKGVSRENLVIATKVRGRLGEGPNLEGLSRAHIMAAVEGSLKRLDTDYIDLYQTHWFDQQTPVEETMRAFDDLVRQGKVRYVGSSNFPAWRLAESLWISRSSGLVQFVSHQPHYNLVHRAEFERELADLCRTYAIGVIPYSPLAGGFLTGKYRKDASIESARLNSTKRYFEQKNWDLLGIMEEVGKRKGGASISQIALAWLLSDSLITSPIIGPRTLEQLKDNVGAAGLRLEVEEKKELEEASDWSVRTK
ncbi:MAG: alcohol dehydrogenase [Chloroflexi bacterium RBG_16_54_18]|nr:MAG: alcohol dehydrogenase [Chloroflexi bacterium RBG_16_54_18]